MLSVLKAIFKSTGMQKSARTEIFKFDRILQVVSEFFFLQVLSPELTGGN